MVETSKGKIITTAAIKKESREWIAGQPKISYGAALDSGVACWKIAVDEGYNNPAEFISVLQEKILKLNTKVSELFAFLNQKNLSQEYANWLADKESESAVASAILKE